MNIRVSKNLTERVYRSIRSDILSCRHRPGAKLRINALAEELEASLGAVREALSRLDAEGFVVAEAQKGFSVSPVSVADLMDLTRTRITIESMCLDRAIAVGGVEWETEIVGAFHRLSRLPETIEENGVSRLTDEWAAAHEKYHSALVAACDSEWLLKIRAMLFDQSDRYRRLTVTQISDRDVQGEHRALMEAVLARESTLSKRLIEEHLDRTAALVSSITHFQNSVAES